jgi:hypothetical protein
MTPTLMDPPSRGDRPLHGAIGLCEYSRGECGVLSLRGEFTDHPSSRDGLGVPLLSADPPLPLDSPLTTDSLLPAEYLLIVEYP